MNNLEQTAEQRRHWSIMRDENLFADDQRGKAKNSPEGNFLAASIPEEIAKRLHYFRTKIKGEKRFYSLGGTARSLQSRSDEDRGTSVNSFVSEVEKATFDDSQLVRVIYNMQQHILQETESSKERVPSMAVIMHKAEAFIEGTVEKNLRYSDKTNEAMQAHAGAQLQFSNFLELLKNKIIFHKQSLAMHPIFSDMDQILQQLDAIQSICRESKLNTSPKTGYITTELPNEYHEAFPQELHAMESQTHNAFTAKALFLHHLKLTAHIKYFFTLASFIEYAERAAVNDRDVQGVFPAIVEPDENGLVLDVEKFAHPAIYRGKPLGKHARNDIYDSLGRDVYRNLERENLIYTDTDETRQSDHFWRQNVTHQTLEEFIERHRLSMSHAEILVNIYERSAFFPFRDIHLSARNRIQIVTGANFNGKSTYMQAVGYLFHQAVTARKFIAENARISLPDLVFDDFDINANRQYDIARERSTFSSQVNKITEFIHRGSPRSIGLFDELYHGTSAPYLLSLGWATIEKFERLGLYAIISTHEPLLTRFTEKEGYESLRGKYHRPPHDASEQRDTSVQNVSLQQRYELKHEPVTDSDAFRIARMENMPEDVMNRAEEILRHITSKE